MGCPAFAAASRWSPTWASSAASPALATARAWRILARSASASASLVYRRDAVVGGVGQRRPGARFGGTRHRAGRSSYRRGGAASDTAGRRASRWPGCGSRSVCRWRRSSAGVVLSSGAGREPRGGSACGRRGSMPHGHGCQVAGVLKAPGRLRKPCSWPAGPAATVVNNWSVAHGSHWVRFLNWHPSRSNGSLVAGPRIAAPCWDRATAVTSCLHCRTAIADQTACAISGWQMSLWAPDAPRPFAIT
jgi:hypothetical protein